MRTIDLKTGPIESRHDPETDRFCIVFLAEQVRLFRVFERAEIEAFSSHLQLRIAGR